MSANPQTQGTLEAQVRVLAREIGSAPSNDTQAHTSIQNMYMQSDLRGFLHHTYASLDPKNAYEDPVEQVRYARGLALVILNGLRNFVMNSYDSVLDRSYAVSGQFPGIYGPVQCKKPSESKTLDIRRRCADIEKLSFLKKDTTTEKARQGLYMLRRSLHAHIQTLDEHARAYAARKPKADRVLKDYTSRAIGASEVKTEHLEEIAGIKKNIDYALQTFAPLYDLARELLIPKVNLRLDVNQN